MDGSAVLKEAWRGVRDTNRRLGLASAAVLAVVGALVTWLATGQFNGSLLVGAVGGAALVFVGVFLWNLWLAPHQLLAAQIQQSKTTAPPKPRLPAEAKPLFDLYVKGQTLLNRTPDLWDGGVPASLAAAVNSWRNEVLAEMLKVGVEQFYVDLFEGEPANDRITNPTRALVDHSLGILKDALSAHYGVG